MARPRVARAQTPAERSIATGAQGSEKYAGTSRSDGEMRTLASTENPLCCQASMSVAASRLNCDRDKFYLLNRERRLRRLLRWWRWRLLRRWWLVRPSCPPTLLPTDGTNNSTLTSIAIAKRNRGGRRFHRPTPTHYLPEPLHFCSCHSNSPFHRLIANRDAGSLAIAPTARM